MRPLVILLLLAALLLPTSASALDCTPFQSWTCANNGYYDLLDGQPGELLCGVDYTGWTFHVIDVTVTTPGWIRFSGISAAASWDIVETAIILMDDCGAATCLESAQSMGMTDLDLCLNVGVHTFVVASNTTAPTAFMNTGIQCLSCEDANAYGFECVYCGSVGSDRAAWGELKSRFR